MERDFIEYLRDILESIEKTGKFIHEMNLSEFEKDDKTIYTVIRAIEVIGSD